MESKLKFSVCCKLFEEVGHSTIAHRKNFRNVLPWRISAFHQFESKDVINVIKN
jgi:hypothetical protein